jgi:hypothetical protein
VLYSLFDVGEAFNYVVASFGIGIEISFEKVGKEKQFQYGKHDE